MLKSIKRGLFLQRCCNLNISSFRSKWSISDSLDAGKYMKPIKTYKGTDAYIPPALYGGRHVVTMLPGHGIGPEMMEHIKAIFYVAKAPVDFEVIDIGANHEEVKYAITSIRRNGACIKGNIDRFKSSDVENIIYRSPNVAIRKKLDLYASLNECKSYKNIKCKYCDLDIIVIRQNTEGEYSLMEHENKPGIVESMKVCTVYNSERIANFAIQYAKNRGRKKITIVHKANIMKLSDGLFLQTIKRVGKDHPSLKIDDMIVDNCCMQMVSNPHQFDVLLCPNLYGTILCNVICGLLGGAGLISSGNYGSNYAAFEAATRSTGSALAGLNKANPVALLNASVDLLYYLGHDEHAEFISNAIKKTLEDDKIATSDVGGKASTTEVVESIKRNVADAMQ